MSVLGVKRPTVDTKVVSCGNIRISTLRRALRNRCRFVCTYVKYFSPDFAQKLRPEFRRDHRLLRRAVTFEG